MSEFYPKHIKEADSYLEKSLKSVKEKNKKISFLKKIISWFLSGTIQK